MLVDGPNALHDGRGYRQHSCRNALQGSRILSLAGSILPFSGPWRLGGLCATCGGEHRTTGNRRAEMTAGWPACWKATAVLTVSVVLPASPFWEMKASVRMQEAWGCVKRAMRVLRFQVTSWGERADWRGVPGRGVALGRLGACFRACTGGAPGETLIAVSRRRGTRAQRAAGLRYG